MVYKIVVFYVSVILFCGATDVAAQVLPHNAVYELSLSKRSDGDDLVDIKGKMTYSLTQNCGSWTTKHHADMMYHYSSGESLPIMTDFTAVEDGKKFDFAINRYEGGSLAFFQRGRGTRDKDMLTVNYRDNDGEHDVKWPNAILFPFEHISAVIMAAKNGEKHHYVRLFDGGDGGMIHDVSTIIGAKKHIKTSRAGNAYWPVSMAFYQTEDDTGIPDYEMHFHMFENGIVEDMEIVYRKFSLHQTLVDLKPLEPLACD